MADNNEQTNETKPLINKDDVLTTQARRIVFDAVMQGYNLKEAAKQAKLDHNYVQKWVSHSQFYSLINQENAKIVEKMGITVEYCQRKFAEIAELAQAKGHYGVARACWADMCKTIGGFQTDAPNPKGLAAKELDKEKVKALAAAADWFYRRKYLAVEPVENIVDVGLNEADNVETGDKQGPNEETADVDGQG